MNKQQRNYAIAKAHVEAIEECRVEAERFYIRENNIVNEDGTSPARLWCIEDDAVFDQAIIEVAALLDDEEYRAAKAALRAAEDALIDYGLSLAPVGIRKTLERGRNVWNIRQKLIDATFRLDTQTVVRMI